MIDYNDPYDDDEEGEFEEDPKQTEELVNRFRDNLKNDGNEFFDDDEAELIILYALREFDFELADEALEYAIRTFPADSYFRILRMRKYMMTFEFDKAEKELTIIEERFAPTCEYYIQKALFLKVKDPNTDILPILSKAELLDPDYPELMIMLATEYLQLEDYKKAYQYTERALVLDSSIEDQLAAFSLHFEETQRYDEALNFFTKLTNRFPLSKGAWFALALAYSSLGQQEKSIDANQYVLSIDDSTATAYYNIGNSYFELKEFDKALENYQTAFELDNNDYISLTSMGDCYYFMNQSDTAMSCYQKARDIAPDHVNAITGILCILKDEEKYAEAELFVDKAFECTPQSFNLLFAVMPFFDKEKQGEKLKKLFKTTFDQIPNKFEFFNMFTLFCIHHEQCEIGIELMKDFLDEEYPEIPYFMAALHYSIKQNEQGAQYLKLALLTNYEEHEIFLSLSPDLALNPEILNLIELYKP
ncbi:MAG: tetratricopeptide repeat protein [Bacteroidales bacterium]|nr:tetratricopeptide repeat protein [Bacteroidales bacterium]